MVHPMPSLWKIRIKKGIKIIKHVKQKTTRNRRLAGKYPGQAEFSFSFVGSMKVFMELPVKQWGLYGLEIPNSPWGWYIYIYLPISHSWIGKYTISRKSVREYFTLTTSLRPPKMFPAESRFFQRCLWSWYWGHHSLRVPRQAGWRVVH